MPTQIVNIQRYALITALAWTLAIVCSFAWFYYQQDRNLLDIARAEARVAYEKDTLYRRWAAARGGMYVPVDAATSPNPDLAHIPERDIVTPSGRALTLMNPAYMTRQVFELADRERALVRGHITSLKPIRPANAPDPWEARAMTAFEHGSREASDLVEIGGKRYMRLMRPFMTEQACLKCHASQGYQVGDLRGGISISVPMAVFSGYTNKLVAGTGAAHGLIWLLGVGMIGLGRRTLSKSALLLEQSEERYRTVADYTADWEYWVAPDGSFRYVSPSCEEVCGYSQGEFYRDPELLLKIVHPKDVPLFSDHQDDGQLCSVQFDFRIITRSGQTRWIAHSCRTVFGRDGHPNGRRAGNRDITNRVLMEQRLHEQALLLEQEIAERQVAQENLQEQSVILEEEIEIRRQAEEAGRLSEEKFSKAFQLAPLIMTITAGDGTFLEVNNRFSELTGFSRQESLGRTAVDLGLITEKDRGLISGVVWREDRISVTVLPLSTKDGRPLVCEYHGEIITVGEQQCLLSIALDVSEQKKLEEQLRHSQKLEAVGELAGGIAHDFNNILTVILGYGSMMELAMKKDDPLKEKLDQILAASEKAAQLTRALLAFSRKQVMNPKVGNLNDIVQGVQKFLVRIIGENIQLKCIFNDAELIVNADQGQLEQVLINLITNARDAMPAGGVLTLESRTVDQDEVNGQVQGCAAAGSYALVSVTDTGSGISEEIRKRIFEPFFTTKETGKGTGLGMAIVHGIVSQHNGFIAVDSVPGQGTTFRIYLPLVAKEAAGDPDAALEEPLRGGSEAVLVAEDELAVRTFMASVLSQYGYRVILARDGEEAVQQYLANRDQIRLCIMDMIMPGKSGKEAFDEIRRLDPGAAALFLSGYTAEIIRSQGDLGPGAELLMKPINPLMLLRKVRQMLDCRSAGCA
jgi:two-component system, cell cycle sensor histidine kinase and response regulator CckA